ncbi:MAG: hypothetical protein KDB09_16235 [Acidimicrobiales bacterium]|nr:hypothetical protein [Acidimicrobiales bacterium]
MNDSDDAGASDLQALADESARQFLDGHLTPEEKRHAFNIGRVCLEFACLEEAIGDLAAGLAQVRSGSTAYMDFVKTGTAVANTIGDISAVDPHWSNLRTDYQRFKTERDRFAHASVGTMVEKKEDHDGRMVFHFVTGRQKHPRGELHRLGQVSDLPSNEATDDLIREMRKVRMQLLMARAQLSFKHIVSAAVPDMKGMVQRIVQPALDSFRHLFRAEGR